METIRFTVNKQRLMFQDPRDIFWLYPASDTVNYYKCEFSFDESWDGFEKRVYFKNESYNIVKSMLLGTSDSCYIPWEVLAHTGKIVCNIVGLKYSNDTVSQRLTTNPVQFMCQVNESVLEPYDQQPLTPTEYEQFRATFEDLYSSTVEARDDAIEAKEDAEQISTGVSEFVAQAKGYKEDSEAYAIGERSGEPVEEDDPTYENNASYYAYQTSLYLEGAVQAKGAAEDARDDATASKLDAASSANSSLLFSYDSEAYAVGKRNGQDVESSDITYHNNSKYYAANAYTYQGWAQNYASNAETQAGYASTHRWAAYDSQVAAAASSLVSEGYANGKQNGTPVTSGSPYYENNSKYYSDRAAESVANSGIIEMTINSSGHLVYTRTQVVAIDFDINTNGHLVVKEAL